MDQKRGPYPSVGFLKQIAANETSLITGLLSGEITVGASGDRPLGASNISGKISDVFMSIEGSGKDDSATLSITGDVKINGTSCLDTTPVIAHVSGEAATNKTTKTSDDTGITQAVMDPDANDVTLGDMLTFNATLTRTASPTTEMKNLAVVVEFEPG